MKHKVYRSLNSNNLARQSGVSLIEILIAVLILGGGALGVASLQLTGLRYAAGSQVRTQATLMANDILDRIRANIDIATNYNTDGFEDDDDSTTNCYTQVCSPEDLVVFDRATWINQVATVLPNGQGMIDVQPATDGQLIASITLQWRQIKETESLDETTKFEQLRFRGAL